MQWWCAAQGEVWDWTWRAYPGVWIFMILLGVGYFRLRKHVADRIEESGREARRGSAAAGLGGLALLWIALDWPIGALGAGYLASVHMFQYLLIALAAPPLLIWGIPAPVGGFAEGSGTFARVVDILDRRALALVVFVGVTIVTHVPSVVDSLMASQVGNFVVDASWLLSGILFWWPIINQGTSRRTFPFPLQVLYLFPVMLSHTAIAAYLIFGMYPRYATYELAPPTGWISALDDQQIAAGLMWVAGTPIIWGVMGFVFRQWAKFEDATPEPETDPGRALRVAREAGR